MRALFVIIVALVAIAVSRHQTQPALQTTSAQAYNSACLVYGNEAPCNLVR